MYNLLNSTLDGQPFLPAKKCLTLNRLYIKAYKKHCNFRVFCFTLNKHSNLQPFWAPYIESPLHLICILPVKHLLHGELSVYIQFFGADARLY